jgi:hypothetical protein
VRWAPDSATARYGLGIVAERLNRVEESRQHAAVAIRLNASVAEEYKAMGIAPLD